MTNIVGSLDVRSFKVIGLWQFIISSRNGQQSYNAKYFVSVNVLLMSLFLPYVLTQLYGSFRFCYDFVTLLEKLAVDITLVESAIKFFYCCTQRRYLGDLSQVFEITFMISAKHDKITSYAMLVDSSRNLTKNINLFIIIIYTTVAVWNSIPIFKCIIEDQCTSLIIMPSWYPFSVNETPTKQLIYISEFIIMCYCASLLYNVNCLLLSYAKLLASQVRVLSLNLLNIEQNARKIVQKEKMDELLKDCLSDHEKILRFAALMEKVYSPLFLFQMIVSTLTLCLVGISLTAQTTNSENSTMSLAMGCKFLMYLVFAVMELLVYSWCGHIVLDQTTSLHEVFYETSWTSGSPTFKKHILIALIKTTSPSRFTAGKFFEINLGTFASVMKASFSYFTFLHGINSNK
ncbi:odorant receptor 2a-like [Lycorma delicatula]|uniref:odorant receptor 2a-like n=1 Tax=Lycorma delicatula TaxID=130591 RepID=UPI003F515509